MQLGPWETSNCRSRSLVANKNQRTWLGDWFRLAWWSMVTRGGDRASSACVYPLMAAACLEAVHGSQATKEACMVTTIVPGTTTWQWIGGSSGCLAKQRGSNMITTSRKSYPKLKMMERAAWAAWPRSVACGAHGGLQQWDSSALPILAVRGAASRLRKCARSLQSLWSDQLDAGLSRAMIYSDESRVLGGNGRKKKLWRRCILRIRTTVAI